LNNEVVSTLGNRAFAHPATAVAAAQDARPLIEIQDLNVQFTLAGTVRAVEDLSYSVYPAMVAIVGESGSGKSVSALPSCSCRRRAPPAFKGSSV
jgi:ABC-type glutathione transport system ATPase component